MAILPFPIGMSKERIPVARRCLLVIAVTLAAVACQSAEDVGGPARSVAPADPDAVAAPAPGAPPPPDPATVGANELGLVPVIMHHRIVAGGGGEYDRSPEEFRAELARLYDAGYRPVRTIDLVRATMDVPAGTTPFVMTFDDSSREQFALNADGEVDPDTAVGILLDFASEREDFDATGSFYVNAGPFGVADSAALLTWLHRNGFELGNHTLGHANLGRASPDEVRQELALGARVVTDHVPQAQVATLSLPLGVWPEPRDLAYAGAHEGDAYAHEGVLLVGAGPAPSPYSSAFDPMAIPRIRSWSWDGGEPNFGSEYWLEWFDDNPERRFVSDGDPDRVSFPAALSDDLDPAFADRARAY